MLKKPINENYCANIIEIKHLIPLENCDNVVSTSIQGNLVIVSKDVQVGDVGIFFPVETKLMPQYLSNNNLYRKSELNVDKEKKGYFEENGRIKCIKFRGNQSMGLFMPLESLDYLKHREKLEVGDEFDHIKDDMICKKYVIKEQRRSELKTGKVHKKKVSRLVDNQFRFHIDTANLGKNLWKVKPNNVISCTEKIHGTSCILSRIICKRKLNPIEKVLKFLGVNINDKEYSNIISSRKVVKNDDMNKVHNHFYNEDIWTIASKKLEHTLLDGMTYYFEIVGYLPSGGMIQKDYDYGCKPGEFESYIYRITYTNFKGNVFEFSAKQVQDWCREHGLNSVPQLYYGYAKDLFDLVIPYEEEIPQWQNAFLERLTQKYLNKKCKYCNNDVPNEGIVLRIESNYIEALKWKSFNFLERETKQLSKGEDNIEDSQSTEEQTEE